MATRKLSLKKITALQEQYGLSDLQDDINSGQAWLREGFYGRTAMECLKDGACMLPEEEHRDYYGNLVPSRKYLKYGTTGTLVNSQNFWQKVIDGEIIMAADEEEFVDELSDDYEENDINEKI